MSVVVRGRIPGREATGDVRLDVAPAVTARDLIGAAVAAQLRGGSPTWADSSRLYLTDEEIAAIAGEGVIRFSARDEAPADVRPAVATATERAVAAFRRGVFVIFAGGRQVGEPDEVIPFQDGDRVVFLRLTALVGG